MKRIVLSLIFMISVVAGGAQRPVPTVRITPEDRGAAPPAFSQMVKSLEYVPLETNDDCLIGTIKRMHITSRYILLYTSPSNLVYLFDRNGRFICQVGNKGGGPGEYNNIAINYLFMDESKQEIVVQSSHPNCLMFYDLKGKYLRSEALSPGRNEAGGCFIIHNSICMFSRMDRSAEYRYYLSPLSDLTKITKRIQVPRVEHKDRSFTSITGRGFHYLYNGAVYVRDNSLNDTIYRIGPDNTFTPYYVINAGKYEITAEIVGDVKNFLRRVKECLNYRSLFETERELLLSYYYNEEVHYMGYNKATKQTYHFTGKNGMANDYDGGVDFWPWIQRGDHYYSYVSASDFLDHDNSIHPKGSPEAIKKVNQLKKRLNEEDNPVVIIATLR